MFIEITPALESVNALCAGISQSSLIGITVSLRKVGA